MLAPNSALYNLGVPAGIILDAARLSHRYPELFGLHQIYTSRLRLREKYIHRSAMYKGLFAGGPPEADSSFDNQNPMYERHPEDSSQFSNDSGSYYEEAQEPQQPSPLQQEWQQHEQRQQVHVQWQEQQYGESGAAENTSEHYDYAEQSGVEMNDAKVDPPTRTDSEMKSEPSIHKDSKMAAPSTTMETKRQSSPRRERPHRSRSAHFVRDPTNAALDKARSLVVSREKSALEYLFLGRSPFSGEEKIFLILDILLVVTCIYNFIVIPIEVAFIADPVDEYLATDPLWRYVFFVDRFVDVLILVDFVLTFLRPIDPTMSPSIANEMDDAARDETSDRAHKHDRAVMPHTPISLIVRRLTCEDPLGFIVRLLIIPPYDMGSELPVIANMHPEVRWWFFRAKVFRLLEWILAKRVMTDNIRSTEIISWLEFYTGVITFSTVEFTKLAVIVLVATHLMSCIWCFLAVSYSEDRNWLVTLTENKGTEFNTNARIYTAALHFSVATLTSVGYGDIYPVTMTEYVAAILFMIVSGALFSYMLANLSSIMEGDAQEREYMMTMDEFNHLIVKERIGPKLANRIRRYWREVQNLERLSRYHVVLGKLTPVIQGDLEMVLAERLFSSVPVFCTLSNLGLTHIAREAYQFKQLFAPDETITMSSIMESRCLCIVINKGLAMSRARILTRDSCWGEDFCLSQPKLRHPTIGYALSYCEIQFMPWRIMEKIFFGDAETPHPSLLADAKTFRKYTARFALRRGIVQLAHIFQEGEEEGISRSLDECIEIYAASIASSPIVKRAVRRATRMPSLPGSTVVQNDKKMSMGMDSEAEVLLQSIAQQLEENNHWKLEVDRKLSQLLLKASAHG